MCESRLLRKCVVASVEPIRESSSKQPNLAIVQHKPVVGVSFLRNLQECPDISNSETYRGLLPPRGDCKLFLHLCLPTTGRNEPLKKERPKWKSDYPMTEGQLRSKRDEFWDTAPAFEGRKEIWDALKAAAVALECNDHELAQAIVDGASITLPHGEDRRQVGLL